MRLVLQRALHARVDIDEEAIGCTPASATRTSGSIDCGFVVLVGFGQDDKAELPSLKVWQTLVSKMLDMRVFPDAQGKLNLSLDEYAATLPPETRCGLLLVSQFTLFADCRRGRRPSFTPAAPPAIAEALYDRLADDLRQKLGDRLQTGEFGAEMRVSFTNWGPVTILLDSDEFGGKVPSS